MNNNIKNFEDFFFNDHQNNLFINTISESINIFYLYVAYHFANKSNFRILQDGLVSKNDDLFNSKYVNIHETKSSKIIEDITHAPNKKIIFTTYQYFKKYSKNYLSINSYDHKEDIRHFLLNIIGIKNKQVEENIINAPELIYSEISKSLVHENTEKNNYSDIKIDAISIIRREIYQSEKKKFNLIHKYNLLKKELLYKKFSFLIY